MSKAPTRFAAPAVHATPFMLGAYEIIKDAYEFVLSDHGKQRMRATGGGGGWDAYKTNQLVQIKSYRGVGHSQLYNVLVARFPDTFKIKYLKAEQADLATSRNMGGGRYDILFVDNATNLSVDCILELLAPIQRTLTVLIG